MGCMFCLQVQGPIVGRGGGGGVITGSSRLITDRQQKLTKQQQKRRLRLRKLTSVTKCVRALLQT